MKTEAEIRAEIGRLQRGFRAAQKIGYGDIVTPPSRIAALEWTLRHGIDACLDMSDWKIADLIEGELRKHLEGKTSVQIFERMTPEERAQIGSHHATDTPAPTSAPTDEEIVEAMTEAYEGERTAEYLENGNLRDNQKEAMRAALAAAKPLIRQQMESRHD